MDNLSQTTTVQSAAMAALHAVEAREAEKQARKEAGIADAINGETGQNVVSRTTSSQSKKSSTGSRTTPAPESESDDYDLGDSDYDSSDSFCLVPSKSSSGDQPTTSKKVLHKENVKLKEQLDAMRGQVMTMHRQMAQRAEQDQQLKDHIIKARNEVSSSI